MTQGNDQRRRLESQRDSLQKTWDLTNDKLKYLRNEFAIETDAANKFKLEQQIKHEETQLENLGRQLEKIEQDLSRSHSFLQGVTNSQTLRRHPLEILNAGQSAAELLEAQNNQVQDSEQSPTEIGDPFHPRLDQKFPKEFAAIYVEEKDSLYIVRLRHSQQRPLDTEPDEPCLSLPKQMDKFNPLEIRGEQSYFSRNGQAKSISDHHLRRFVGKTFKILGTMTIDTSQWSFAQPIAKEALLPMPIVKNFKGLRRR